MVDFRCRLVVAVMGEEVKLFEEYTHPIVGGITFKPLTLKYKGKPIKASVIKDPDPNRNDYSILRFSGDEVCIDIDLESEIDD